MFSRENKQPIIETEREYRKTSRRELLKLPPLLIAGAIAIPSVRTNLLNGGLAVSDSISAEWFRRKHPAQTYLDSGIRPLSQFPLNSFNADDPGLDLAAWRLHLGGLVKQSGDFRLEDIQSLPRMTQNTRHICVEGWDVIGKFAGVRISDFLQFVGADTRANARQE